MKKYTVSIFKPLIVTNYLLEFAIRKTLTLTADAVEAKENMKD